MRLDSQARYSFESAREWKVYQRSCHHALFDLLKEHGYEAYIYQYQMGRENVRPWFWNRMAKLVDGVMHRIDKYRKETDTDTWYPDSYEHVMDGTVTLLQWQSMVRQQKMKKAAESIRPSNSRATFHPVFATRKAYKDCGLTMGSKVFSAINDKFGTGNWRDRDNVYVGVRMQSDWLTHWALDPDSHRSLPANYMFCAAEDQKHLSGRKCAKVKTIRSMTGCRYEEGEGYTTLWCGRFILSNTRRSLINQYKRLMSDCIVEQRFKHLTDGLVDNKNGRIDKMTKQSIYEAIAPIVDEAYEAGLDQSSLVLSFYDERKVGA